MRAQIGGVEYDANAALQFGSPDTRDQMRDLDGQAPRVELHLLIKSKNGADAADTDNDNQEESADEPSAALTSAAVELDNAER